MKHTLTKLASSAVALAMIASMAPTGVLAIEDDPNVQLSAPSAASVDVSALLDEDATTGAAIDNDAVAAAIASISPIGVTLANNGAGTTTDYAAVRTDATSVTPSGHVQLWAQDTNGDWFDVAKSGWGPSTGFPLPYGASNGPTDIYPVSDQAGEYTLTTNLVDVSDATVITSVTTTLTVNEPTPAAPIVIHNVSELQDAIRNQQAGQTWTIEAGDYALDRMDDVTAGNETGWYFPITKDDLTIQGEGNPVIYGHEYSANGEWSSQDLIAVFGDNVTIKGLTLMSKVEGNKTLEVIGSDATIEDMTIEPNTKVGDDIYDNMSSKPDDEQFSKEWGGSLYFNGAGNHTVRNVTIKNAGISFRYSPDGTHITFDNVNIVNATAIDAINSYRYSSGFNTSGSDITGTPTVTYEVSDALGNLDSVLRTAQDGDTISFESDITATTSVLLTKAVTIEGNGHTLTLESPDTTGGSTSLGFGVQADATVKDLAITTSALADNLVEVANPSGTATFENVSVTNSKKAGITVLDGKLVLEGDIALNGNTWGGVEVKNVSGANVEFADGATLSFSPSSDPAFLTTPVAWVDADVTANADDFVTDSADLLSDPVLTGTQVWWNLAPAPSDDDDDDDSGSSRRHGSSGQSAPVPTVTTAVTTPTAGTTVGQVLGAATFNFTRDLYFGVVGDDVKELQTELIAAGYSIPDGPTTYFGPQTRAAVSAWQASNGVMPTAGYFGPLSRAKYLANGGFGQPVAVPQTPVSTTTTSTTTTTESL